MMYITAVVLITACIVLAAVTAVLKKKIAKLRRYEKERKR